MSDIVISPNMSLPVPVVSLEPGPDYASDVNNCLGLVDSHDHSFGKGVPVTPNGLNINADLSINNNNLTAIRSSRFQSQPSPLAGVADLDCLYVSGVDLYYNDGVSNQVRITQNGGVAGSPGSIANLTSPASASYSAGSKTFIWESDASTAANMDNGSVTIREVVANANGITLSSPTSLSNDYTLTLFPSLPGSTSFVVVDSSGNLSTPAVYPLTAASLANNSVTFNKRAVRATGTTVGLGGVAISGSCGNFNQVVGASAITAFNITLTTQGGPVFLGFVDDGTNTPSNIQNPPGVIQFQILENSTPIADITWNNNNSGVTMFMPVSAVNKIYLPAGGAGTYTYTVNMGASVNTQTLNFANFIAYEL